MKILMIPSWYSTEENPLSGIFFKEYAEALVSYGHEVAIVYIDIQRIGNGKKQGVSVRNVNGVKEFRYNGINYTPRMAYGVNWQKRFHAKKLLDRVEAEFGKPDAVHLESCDAVYIAEMAAKKWKTGFVYTEHLSNLVLDRMSSYYSRLFREALLSAGASVAISKLFFDKMSQFGESKIHYIPNGIAVEKLLLSKPGDTFVIKALGALRTIKGYDYLIRAFAGFAEDKKNVKLVIGGDGAERDSLEELARTLPCRDNVFFEGNIPREQVTQFYEDCSVFVCSSQIETFSIVTAEALCSGVPVVATKCGGPEDMINDSNGILVDVKDISGMTQALNRIYSHFNEYDQMAIKEQAEERFQYKKIIEQYTCLYERVNHEYQ